MTILCDFLVIGAGIAGASAASELVEAGTKNVVLVERESHPGYHSTGRSAAIFTETYGHPTVRAMAQASRSFFENPPPGFCDHPLLSPRSVMLMARDDQCAAAQAAFDAFKDEVPSLRLIDGAEVEKRLPALKKGYATSAVLEPNAKDLDVHALHQGYLRRFKAGGGTLVCNAEVLGLERLQDVWLVKTKAGEFRAPVVINAAGAWCDEVAKIAGGAPLELSPCRRTAVTVEVPSGNDVTSWPMTLDVEEAFYFKPDAGHLMLSPADETKVPPCDVQPEEMDVAIAVDAVQNVLDFPISRIVSKWAGLRTFAPDRVPVAGFDGSLDGFFWLAGQGGYGIMTAPAMARTAASLILFGEIPADVSEFGVAQKDLSPTRFF